MSSLEDITLARMREEIGILLRVPPKWHLNRDGHAIDWRTGKIYYIVLGISWSRKRVDCSKVTLEIAMRQGHFRTAENAKAYDLLPGLEAAFIVPEKTYTGTIGLDASSGNLLAEFGIIETEIALRGRFELT